MQNKPNNERILDVYTPSVACFFFTSRQILHDLILHGLSRSRCTIYSAKRILLTLPVGSLVAPAGERVGQRATSTCPFQLQRIQETLPRPRMPVLPLAHSRQGEPRLGYVPPTVLHQLREEGVSEVNLPRRNVEARDANRARGVVGAEEEGLCECRLCFP